MFIYSVRAATIRFFSVIVLTLAVLIALLFLGGVGQNTVSASSTNVDFSGVKTNEDRVNFISEFGIKVNPDAIEAETFRVPENFDRVIAGYNEIQKRQGLDLSKYKKKNVMRYTYEVKNYKDYEGTVYANIIVYRNKVIGGDICSADVTGFIHGFEK